MESRLDSLLSSYEDEISLLDSLQWEQNLPRVADFSNMKKSKIKGEMIDVDLVRGSTFPKTKTRRDVVPILLRSLFHLLFFPLQYTWWIKKTNKLVYIAGLHIYISSWFNILHHFYLTREESSSDGSQNTQSVDLYSDRDILEPVVIFGLLIFLQIFIHFSSSGKEFSSRRSSVGKNFRAPSIDKSMRGGELLNSSSPEKLFPWPETECELIKPTSEKPLKTSSTNTSPCSPIKTGRQNPPMPQSLGNLIPSKPPAIYTERKNTLSDESADEGNLSALDTDAPKFPEFTSEPETDQESLLSESEPSPIKSRKMSREKTNWNSRNNSRERMFKSSSTSPVSVKIGCTVWNKEEPSKIRLSALEIGSAIFERSRERSDSNIYAGAGVAFAVIIGALPAIFQPSSIMKTFQGEWCYETLIQIIYIPYSLNFEVSLNSILRLPSFKAIILLNLVCLRILLWAAFFFLLAVTEKAFRRRFQIAKLFSQITSTRRSMKSRIPHFRLYKVRNIKTWLCVRSFLRKRGPKRSIDLIVSAAFMITLGNVLFLCYELLKDEDVNPEFNRRNTEVICCSLFIGCFLIRYMTLSSKINQKYWNPSVLLTEQINLYLRMEEKPEKKEQLTLANNVLKLSGDLLKELEKPYNIVGLSANPLLYNITKLLVLSAVSGALSEMLGFKLKLYKVKIG